MALGLNEASGVEKSSLPRENQITDPWPIDRKDVPANGGLFTFLSG